MHGSAFLLIIPSPTQIASCIWVNYNSSWLIAKRNPRFWIPNLINQIEFLPNSSFPTIPPLNRSSSQCMIEMWVSSALILDLLSYDTLAMSQVITHTFNRNWLVACFLFAAIIRNLQPNSWFWEMLVCFRLLAAASLDPNFVQAASQLQSLSRIPFSLGHFPLALPPAQP